MEGKKSTHEWREILKDFESSGMTRKSFCQEHGIALSTFGFWKKKLQSVKRMSGNLVRIERRVPSMKAATINVIVDARVTVDVPAGVHEEDLTRVLSVVRSVWCS